MIVPCPKCGGDSDDTGSKYVCGECYWVFDKGAQAIPAGGGGGGGGASAFSSAAASAPAYNGPTMCPKCSGKLLDISGKMVCEDCYHVLDQPAGAKGAPRPVATAFPQQAAPQPLPVAAARPAPAAAPAQMAMPSACPKCGGKLVDIAGKPVCESCFHVVDGPVAATAAPQAAPQVSPQAAPQGTPQSAQPAQAQQYGAPQAPQQMGAPAAPMPQPTQNIVPSPQASSPAPAEAAVPTTCPKCNGNLVNMAGAYVCESCYHTVDIPGAPPKPAPTAPTPSPLRSPGASPAPSNFTPPTPSGPPTISRNNFRTTAGPGGGEGEASPQMIGGILLIIFLVIMIVFLAIKH